MPFPVTIQAAYAYDALMVYAEAIASLLDPLTRNSTNLHQIALDGRKLINKITLKSNFPSELELRNSMCEQELMRFSLRRQGWQAHF